MQDKKQDFNHTRNVKPSSVYNRTERIAAYRKCEKEHHRLRNEDCRELVTEKERERSYLERRHGGKGQEQQGHETRWQIMSRLDREVSQCVKERKRLLAVSCEQLLSAASQPEDLEKKHDQNQHTEQENDHIGVHETGHHGAHENEDHMLLENALERQGEEERERQQKQDREREEERRGEEERERQRQEESERQRSQFEGLRERHIF